MHFPLGQICRRNALSLFRTSRFQVESFITNRRIHRHQHQTDVFQATDSFIPNGYNLFRADAGHPTRSGKSI
jgi:hypothetical protein